MAPQPTVHERHSEGQRDLSIGADRDEATTASQGLDQVEDVIAHFGKVGFNLAHANAHLVSGAGTQVRFAHAGA